MRITKKGVMGIGMLMIFISTILVSAIAAGVLIRSTGLLQERSLLVAESARERLVSGIQVFAVYASGNSTTEKLSDFEFLTRVRAGSPPIQMRNLGLSFVSENLSFSAALNTSKLGDVKCTYSNLGSENEYCFDNRLGNNDTVLEEGELLAVKYKLNTTNALAIEKSFEVTFQPKKGALEVLELRTPDLVLSSKIRLR